MSFKLIEGPKVKLSYSADNWQIFNEHADDPALYVKGISRDEVAAALNEGVAELLAAAPSRKDFDWRAAEKLLDKYSEYGAADSEGYSMLEHIVEMAYPS